MSTPIEGDKPAVTVPAPLVPSAEATPVVPETGPTQELRLWEQLQAVVEKEVGVVDADIASILAWLKSKL